MARIAGIELPPSKRARIGLTYIFGIGKTRALEILAELPLTLDSEKAAAQLRSALETRIGIAQAVVSLQTALRRRR